MRSHRRRTRLAALLLSCLAFAPSSPGRARPAAPLAATPAPFRDCNANGVEDAVDIARGTSSDTDMDGVPDECQGHAVEATAAMRENRLADGTGRRVAGV